MDLTQPLELGLRGARLGVAAYRAYKMLRGSKSAKRPGFGGGRASKRIRITRRIALNPPGNYVKNARAVYRRKKRKSFAERVSAINYPPFTITDQSTGSVESQSPNQGVQNFYMQTLDNLKTAFYMQRDIYHNNFGSAKDGTMQDNSNNADSLYNSSNSGQRMVLKSFSCLTKFLNSATSTASIEVLVLTPNRLMEATTGTQILPETWWTQVNTNAMVMNQSTINNAPYEGQGVDTAIPYTWLGDRPYKSSTKYDFARMWKIVRRDRRTLEPGQLWRHSFVYAKNTNLNWLDLAQYSRMPYKNFYMLVIVNGQIINGKTAGSADISVSDTQVSATIEKRWNFALIKTTRRVVTRTTGVLPTVAAVNQQFVNEDELAMDNYVEG